jgi:hypothetical protein
MLVDVFTPLSPVPQAEIPEMFDLDHDRILEAGKLTRKLITTGAVLLQCKNLLKRDVRAPWKLEAQRIMQVLDRADLQEDVPQETIVDGIMAALEAGRSMPAATKVHLRALVDKFVGASLEASRRRESDPRDPVLRLLLNRLRGYILARLTAASASEKAKATSTAGEKLASLGLAESVDRVRDMVEMLSRVSSADRDAHGGWWDKVAEGVEREDASSSFAGPQVARE